MPLVLKRRIGERFTIGDKIEIRVLERLGNWVTLLIDAPGLEINRRTKEDDARDRRENKRRLHEKRGLH